MTLPPPPPRPAGVPPPNVRYRVPVAAGPGGPIPPRQRPPARTPVLAPILALVGLLVIGGASLWGITLLGVDFSADSDGETPIVGAQGNGGDGTSGTSAGISGGGSIGIDAGAILGEQVVVPDEDGAPSVGSTELAVPPEAERPDVKGTILFTRDGDIWAASGAGTRRLTSNRSDSSPTWSPDGKHIYFIRTRVKQTSRARLKGKYTFYIPDVMRMNADGSKRKRIHDAILKGGSGDWFSHILQPDVSPDGKKLAVVSDGRTGAGPVVLHTLSTKGTGGLRRAKVNSVGDLGHNDPDWSPDGRKLALTRNQAKGTTGIPQIVIFDCKSRKNCDSGRVKQLKAGYANPSWFPDRDWLAAEKTTGTGRDIVIVRATRGGDEIARLTTDGDSFAPVVSPDGDQVAYLQRNGVGIDLRIMTLDLSGNRVTLVDDRPITVDGGIDAGSSPAWFIPRDELTPRVDETGTVERSDPLPGDVASAPGEEAVGAIAP